MVILTPRPFNYLSCYINSFKSQDFLPTSLVLASPKQLNISTINLDILRMIHESKFNIEILTFIARK